MKNKSGIKLVAIKDNKQIVNILKKNKKVSLSFVTIWYYKSTNKSLINYALLVNKSQFKLAVTRNKIKRQLRNILIASDIKGGLDILIKPNAIWLKKQYLELSINIINTITKFNNGK